ncbi:hypothetical protein TTHERM_01143880 (macronuclear) [Tetrahymena thermophila SB210]|uniref:Uncharacterized protein n=1 Tax=Tetrahymena thermophila (strain SB210) TaxID=312017 RepID=Q24DN4_TETTS|nr:hypothetical protein TTHERM_01143880 [Tetrahymena thermophila SB210]EAS05879.1 hypothetical protein TTHERM_01143880 [Tetrahymena thermophila SB210]|eukprot:XP_001026124.1 hypothetical protein TTHERM_01143880 [Tetrahymena thermophila SB210]
MSSYYRRESSERSTERQQINRKKSEKEFEWNNQLQTLENELEEKIKKEKEMCYQINNLKEDLEKKLKELDENQSQVSENNSTQRFQSRKNVFGTFKQKTNTDKMSSLAYTASTIKKKQSQSPIRDIGGASTYSKQKTYTNQSPRNKTPTKQTNINYTELKTHVSSKSSNNILQSSNQNIKNKNIMINVNQNGLGSSFATQESKEITYAQIAEERIKSGERLRSNLEQERQILILKQANEVQENEIKRLRSNKQIDQERYEALQKENISILQKLKELEIKYQVQNERIKDIEWENNKLMDEVNIKDARVKQIKDNDFKVKEYQEKYELKVLEIQALQRQIDQINEKHLQFKLQMQQRDSDIKNEIKTSELIIQQQESQIQNLNEQILELQNQNTAILREQHTTTQIEEDWKNEVSCRIQKEKEIEDLLQEIRNIKENNQIKEVQQQGKMLLLFAENERLHQIIMNMQMEVKTLKGQVSQYQQNTFNISFNSANKPSMTQGINATQEELEKVKLHLQVKLKENENLRNQISSLEQLPQIVTELERKLKLQISENKRLTQMIYGRLNDKW